MNSSVSMTKEAYFEMCEALGTEPVEEEIPVDVADLPTDVQQALDVYFKLRDEWDTMNGNYMGKSYAGILDLFKIMELPESDHRMIYDLIVLMDHYRSKAIKSNKPVQTNKKPAGPKA